MFTKVCKKCERELDASELYFYKKKSGKYGLEAICKECRGFSFGEPQIKKTQKNIKEGFKTCTKCNEEYLATTEYFSKETRGKYGVSSYCKKCKSLLDKERKEKTGNAKWKEWYKANRERMVYKAVQYITDNKDAVNERRRKYYSKCDKVKIYNRRRESKKNNVVATLTTEDWNECLAYFDYKDAYTGEIMEIISQDHVIPVDDGGAYCKKNIIPCESRINSSKGNRDFEEWYKKQPYFSEPRLKKIYKWIGYDETTQIQQLALF